MPPPPHLSRPRSYHSRTSDITLGVCYLVLSMGAWKKKGMFLGPRSRFARLPACLPLCGYCYTRGEDDLELDSTALRCSPFGNELRLRPRLLHMRRTKQQLAVDSGWGTFCAVFLFPEPRLHVRHDGPGKTRSEVMHI